ncbi:MAG: GcrA family cell cycle regulator [Pseudomonadota bacterium]
MATWTEERVARLAKLWAEGLSASQIAADLGEVTRNAVIGKVHRLGLSGRDKPAGKGGNRKKTTTAKAAGKPAAPKPSSARAKPAEAQPHTAKDKPAFDDVDVKDRLEAETIVEAAPANDNSEPKSRKLTLMQLTENTCKWPTGDPTMPGFSFCGHPTEDDKPYCAFHNKVAFQPPSDRRRRR